jgi:hemoglobin/transferrin/lactoferrin receptor protein
MSGGAGVLFRIGGSVRITANAGRAFRAPALEERFFRGPGQAGFVTGCPGLRSETSVNLDVGLKWKTERMEGELAAFRNRVDDLIVLRTVNAGRDTLQYANVGRALLRGAEFRSGMEVTDNLSIGADASCVFAEDVLASEPLPLIPPVRGTLSMAVHGGRVIGPHRWRLEADVRMIADQNRTARNESRTPGYALLDLDFGFGFNPGAVVNLPMTVTVSVQNAFDRRYRDHLSSVYWRAAPGRDVVVGLKVMI